LPKQQNASRYRTGIIVTRKVAVISPGSAYLHFLESRTECCFSSRATTDNRQLLWCPSNLRQTESCGV
jgi:hypothetical protein